MRRAFRYCRPAGEVFDRYAALLNFYSAANLMTTGLSCGSGGNTCIAENLAAPNAARIISEFQLWHPHCRGFQNLEDNAMSLLYSPVTFGPYTFKNRLVMSPMTRSRALGNIPNDLMAEYYKQRASSAGLIITEGTSPSPNGLGYPRVPGIFSAAQVVGWKKITDAVHSEGAKFFVQLMHTGRIGHQNNLPQGASVVGPSAIVAAGEMHTDALMSAFDPKRTLELRGKLTGG
jgi:NADH:flavin oxidoreductase / NADH oxidase family